MDRNRSNDVSYSIIVKSLSARRAWIEIANFCRNRFCPTVALRKESVDRNQALDMSAKREERSLSARRAWIEISTVIVILRKRNVALRKESVDRNDVIRPAIDVFLGRSPQGERG